MEIRVASEDDRPAIWPLVVRVAREEEPYAFEPDPTTRGRLWLARLGFEILGTLHGAFEHPTHGYVGLHVMDLSLV